MSTDNIERIKLEISKLQNELEEAKKNKKKEVISEVRKACKEFKISAGHLRGALYEPKKK